MAIDPRPSQTASWHNWPVAVAFTTTASAYGDWPSFPSYAPPRRSFARVFDERKRAAVFAASKELAQAPDGEMPVSELGDGVALRPAHWMVHRMRMVRRESRGRGPTVLSTFRDAA